MGGYDISLLQVFHSYRYFTPSQEETVLIYCLASPNKAHSVRSDMSRERSTERRASLRRSDMSIEPTKGM